MSDQGLTAPDEPEPLSELVIKSGIGGILMGLANLVPGISGGTMLLAAGIYPRFIRSIADLTTLKFSRAAIVVLGTVVALAGASILVFAGPVKTLVVEHRWVMYSIFIGLTLGGLPVVWKLARPPTASLWGGAVGGFLVMGALAWFQAQGNAGGAVNQGWIMMFIAGVAGASAMILPGVSGGYLLLVLGVYVPVLAAIEAFKNALKAGDIAAATEPTLAVILPVGIGVVIGVLGVSNLLKVFLQRFEKATLGVLLGLLAGAVVGLWPFQRGVAPKVGDMFKGQPLTAEKLATLDASKWPTEYFEPTALQIGGAIGLILAGVAVTLLIAKFGQSKKAA